MSIRKGDYSRAEQHYTHAMALLDACNLVSILFWQLQAGFPPVLSSFQTKHAQGTIKDIPVLSPLLQFFFALSGQANPRLQKEKHHGRPNTPVSQKIRSFNLCCELQHGCFSAATGVFDPSGLGVKRQLVLYLSEPSEHRAVNQSQWHSLEARQGNESMSVQYAQLLIDKFVATGDTVLHGSQLGCRSCDENCHLMDCAVRSDETIYMNLRTILPYCNNLYHILPWLQLAALHCVWQKSTIVGTFAPNPVNSYRTRDNSCHMLSYNECIVRHSGQAKLAPLLTSGNCICESIDTVVQTSRFFFQGARIFRDGTINMINKNHKNMLHVSCLCRLCSSSNISGPIGS